MNLNELQELNISDVKNAIGDNPVNSDFIVAQPGELKTTINFREPIRFAGGAFILGMQGEAKVTVNLLSHTLRKGTMLILPMNSIIQYHDHSKDFKPYIVGFSPNLFGDGLQLRSVIPLMTEILENPLFEISESDSQLIVNCCKYISEKSTEHDHPYRMEIMKNLLLSLFYEVSYIFQKQRSNMVLRQKTHNEEVMMEFGRLLKHHYRSERNVEFYADQLCLTPKYLSMLIKKTSGKSVPEWVRTALLMDAKIQLKYSTLTVQQISDMLIFPNPSFFGRFFKKYTGVTPLEYRKS